MKKLLLVLLLLIPHPSFAAFTTVQKAVLANGGTMGSPVSAGNLLVLLVSVQDGGSSINATGVSDGTNMWVHATSSVVHLSPVNADFWYVLSAAATTPTITVTFSASPVASSLHIREFSHSGTVSFDKSSTAVDAGSVSNTTSSLTTANNNELIVTAMVTFVPAMTVPSGFSNTDHLSDTASYYDESTDLLDAGAAGSHAINWALNSPSAYTQTNVAFIESGGGSSAPPSLSLLGVGR